METIWKIRALIAQVESLLQANPSPDIDLLREIEAILAIHRELLDIFTKLIN